MTDTRKGKIVIKTFGVASKSRHDAVYLVTGDEEFVLRQKGTNPFTDNPLAKLEGREVEVTGRISDYIFWVEKWKEVNDE